MYFNYTVIIEKMQQNFTPEHPETKFQKAYKLYMIKKAMPKIIDLFWTMKNMKSKHFIIFYIFL